MKILLALTLLLCVPAGAQTSATFTYYSQTSDVCNTTMWYVNGMASPPFSVCVNVATIHPAPQTVPPLPFDAGKAVYPIALPTCPPGYHINQSYDECLIDTQPKFLLPNVQYGDFIAWGVGGQLIAPPSNQPPATPKPTFDRQVQGNKQVMTITAPIKHYVCSLKHGKMGGFTVTCRRKR